jgi:hypothetical protein
MKRCTYCFRYWFGEPVYCPRCDRTFDQRICARGHVNARDVQACHTCGTPHLSVPAPVSGRFNAVALWTVRVAASVTAVLLAFTLIVDLYVPLDWHRLGPRFLLLVVMPWVLYRTTWALPGPIRKAARPRLTRSRDGPSRGG